MQQRIVTLELFHPVFFAARQLGKPIGSRRDLRIGGLHPQPLDRRPQIALLAHQGIVVTEHAGACAQYIPMQLAVGKDGLIQCL